MSLDTANPSPVVPTWHKLPFSQFMAPFAEVGLVMTGSDSLKELKYCPSMTSKKCDEDNFQHDFFPTKPLSDSISLDPSCSCYSFEAFFKSVLYDFFINTKLSLMTHFLTLMIVSFFRDLHNLWYPFLVYSLFLWKWNMAQCPSDAFVNKHSFILMYSYCRRLLEIIDKHDNENGRNAEK